MWHRDVKVSLKVSSWVTEQSKDGWRMDQAKWLADRIIKQQV
jgi:hypothetical protein